MSHGASSSNNNNNNNTRRLTGHHSSSLLTAGPPPYSAFTRAGAPVVAESGYDADELSLDDGDSVFEANVLHIR